MEKKQYVKPAMQVYDLPDSQRILCYSGPNAYLPGLPADDKHLA
jgi:hypothetical protein